MNLYFDFTQYMFFIFLLGVVLGAGAVWAIMRKRVKELEIDLKRTEKERTEIEKEEEPFGGASLDNARDKQGKERLIEKQAREKEENKRKVMEFFDEAQNKRVTNDDIEALLGVSDATATRYFDELEKEGLIWQVGKTGRHVYYEKIQQ